ncbi:hypothetical protein TcCL_NonESM00695 [Trypanosoma cruzi]|nr:hypothetical protein TcCL_NonESM00695 [Trypanosoma cruzi]
MNRWPTRKGPSLHVQEKIFHISTVENKNKIKGMRSLGFRYYALASLARWLLVHVEFLTRLQRFGKVTLSVLQSLERTTTGLLFLLLFSDLRGLVLHLSGTCQ